MKRICKAIVASMLVVGLVSVPAQAKSTKTDFNVTSNVVVKSSKKSEVKLKWNKKDREGFSIYRAEVTRKKPKPLWEKVGNVSGTKTSYKETVAYGKEYMYKVSSNSLLSEKKNVNRYSKKVSVHTDLGVVEWIDDSVIPFPFATTPEKITLSWNYYSEGCKTKIKGYELYRKKKGGKFKKILVTKDTEFEDTDIEPGATYYYKLRAYAKVKGKKVYSAYTGTKKLLAINGRGKYEMEILSKPIYADSYVVKLTSDKYNASTVILGDEDWRAICTPGDQYETDGIILDQYSTDGVTWKKFNMPSPSEQDDNNATLHVTGDKSFTLKPGKTVYLKFAKRVNNKIVAFDWSRMKKYVFYSKYNDYLYFVNLDFDNNDAYSEFDHEEYGK